MSDGFCALVAAKVSCFLKSMRRLFQVLYHEFGNEWRFNFFDVEIGSTIADLDLQDTQCPITAKEYLRPANLQTHGEEMTISGPIYIRVDSIILTVISCNQQKQCQRDFSLKRSRIA